MLCSVPLSDVKAKSPRWRFNISLLSNQTFITSLKEYIREFLEINMPSDVDQGSRLRPKWSHLRPFFESVRVKI